MQQERSTQEQQKATPTGALRDQEGAFVTGETTPPPPPPSHHVPEPCPSALRKEMGSPSTPRPQTRMMQPHIIMIMPQEGIQEGVVRWFWLEYRHWSVLSLWAFITATAGTYQLHLESESWNCHQLWRSLSLWEFFFFSIPKIAFFQPLLWHSH